MRATIGNEVLRSVGSKQNLGSNDQICEGASKVRRPTSTMHYYVHVQRYILCTLHNRRDELLI